MITNNSIPKENYKVLCNCCTFNQSQYIEDTLNGFTKQITDFPYVCIIIDDASTDGNQDVIRKYLDSHFDMTGAEDYEIETSFVTVAKHKTNPNCTFAVYFLKQNLYRNQPLKETHFAPWRDHCEYEAFCEGDDYWISERHLQSKVGWLEKNLEYSACVNNIKIVIAGDYPIPKYKRSKADMDLSIEDIISRKKFYQTASLVIRRDVYAGRNNELPQFRVGDYPLYVYAAYNGKIRMQKEYMTAYRVGVPGSANTNGVTKNKDILLNRLTDSHYMLETLNSYTQFQYDSLFKNRWYINLMRYCKHTQQYGQMRDAFSRISCKVDTMGLKWTIGHILGCYFRLFDLHILK